MWALYWSPHHRFLNLCSWGGGEGLPKLFSLREKVIFADSVHMHSFLEVGGGGGGGGMNPHLPCQCQPKFKKGNPQLN